MRSHTLRLPTGLPSYLVLLLSLFTIIESAVARVENRTIDDNLTVDQPTHKAPVYQPPEKWNFGPSCQVCSVHLESQFTYDNTWHDATATSSQDFYTMTLTFTGTALYVYGIVPNLIPDTATHVNLTFTMDGQPVGPSYYHAPSVFSDIEYNVSVYSVTGLENKQHTFVLRPTAGDEQSLMVFDYAVYTYDDEVDGTTSSSASGTTSSGAPLASSNKNLNNVGAIAGGVVGGVTALLAASLIVICTLRRRLKPRTLKDGTIEKGYRFNPEELKPQPFIVPVASRGNPGRGQPGSKGGSPAAHSEGPALAAATLGTGTSASAMRQAALEHQLAELQRQVGAVQSVSRTHTPARRERAEGVGATVRAQLDALRSEVERLRAENTPPAYSGQRPARDEASEATSAPNERLDSSGSARPTPSGKRARGVAPR